MNIGLISYSLGGICFAVLSILLVTSWQGRIQGGLLVLASITSIFWNGIQAYEAIYYSIPASILVATDIIKLSAWIIFLLGLLNNRESNILPAWGKKALYLTCLAALCYSIFVYFNEMDIGFPGYYYTLLLYSMLLLPLIGLVLVEQLYRNTQSEQLWAIKYLFLALAGLFIYDIFLYSNNILFKEINRELWESRGGVYALLVPLIAISAARNPQWSLGVHVSRNVVFYTTSLVSVGVYLLVISISGYYIKIYGGGWGTFAQILFVAITGIIMSVLFFSGHVRARVKQFVGTHFYSYKYDYREEWLRLMRILSASHDEGMPLQQRVIKAVSQIVESPGGCLWVKMENELYVPVANWNMTVSEKAILSETTDFIHFIRSHQGVVNIYEYNKYPEKYENLDLPDWLKELNKAWLIIPIVLGEELYGFIIILQSIGIVEQSWEDSELLRTVGQQIASYLAQQEVAQKLAETRQFDAFNRLSAYVVHDLKNVVAQLGLVVSNASRHKDNPEFMADAITTVESAVSKMNRMLAQLRKSRFTDESISRVSLNSLLQTVVKQRANIAPVPTLALPDKEISIELDSERMASVIEHLVQNAQEATPAGGEVNITMQGEEGMVIIRIEDTGSGMDKEFIRKRLFRPFDTTKGNAGMGVGVYESREFIHQLGGAITVESEVGKGTVFSIRIPYVSRDNRDGQ